MSQVDLIDRAVVAVGRDQPEDDVLAPTRHARSWWVTRATPVVVFGIGAVLSGALAAAQKSRHLQRANRR